MADDLRHRCQKDIGIDWGLSLWAVAMGLVVAIYAERLVTETWRYAFIPGGYELWAGMLIVFGTVMAISLVMRNTYPKHSNGVFVMGLLFTGLWWVTLSGAFLKAAIVDSGNPVSIVCAFPLGLLYWWWAWHLAR